MKETDINTIKKIENPKLQTKNERFSVKLLLDDTVVSSMLVAPNYNEGRPDIWAKCLERMFDEFCEQYSLPRYVNIKYEKYLDLCEKAKKWESQNKK